MVLELLVNWLCDLPVIDMACAQKCFAWLHEGESMEEDIKMTIYEHMFSAQECEHEEKFR